MRILIACEESQRMCIAFRARGHEAYSCDLMECSGGHPEWHIKGDVLPILNGNIWFLTQDLCMHSINGSWDMIIAHPPCTYLTNAGTSAFSLKVNPPEKVIDRWDKRCAAAVFFMQCVLADCPRIAVENPVGIMSRLYRPPDQIIHPYYFIDDPQSPEYVSKATCLWLKGLPLLICCYKSYSNAKRYGVLGNSKARCWTDIVKHDSVTRSKSFNCICAAIADQWGNV